MIAFSGGLRSALLIGGQGIRARKLRTLLSMLSLFLGVLAVVVVQAAAETGRRATLGYSELAIGKDGTLQMYVVPHEAGFPIILDTLRGRADAIAITMTQAIIGESGVRPINPGGGRIDTANSGSGPAPEAGFVVCDSRGICRPGPDPAEGSAPPGRAIELRLTAMTGDIRQFKPFRVESGQWLDFDSAPSLAPRIVLNKEAAKGFARHQVPARMRIAGAIADPTPQLIGVVDDGMFEPAAYVRADELLNWMPEGKLGALAFNGGLQMLLSPEATDVERILRARLLAIGMTEDQIHTEPIRSRHAVEQQLLILQWIFLGLASLVLLIGVAGILNVGLATVGERVEEFALRRAVGTPRSLLAGIVLVETMLTGLFTAGLAIGVGALVLTYGGRFLDAWLPYGWDLEFPWQAGAAGVVAGLTAGLLGGLVPAIRAARIPIAAVMRA